MDKRRAAIERALRREDYPKFDHDPREQSARPRWRRPGGDTGLEPAPVAPRDGGGLSGGAAVAIEPGKDR